LKRYIENKGEIINRTLLKEERDELFSYYTDLYSVLSGEEGGESHPKPGGFDTRSE